mgnify:CR=1 FL=1
MKLLRIGETGSEKPSLIDSQNKYRDLSSVIKDYLNVKYTHMGLKGWISETTKSRKSRSGDTSCTW